MRIVDYLNSADGDADHHDSVASDSPIVHKSCKSERSMVIGRKPYCRRRKLVSRLFSFAWKCGSGRLSRREEKREEEDNDTCGSAVVSDSSATPNRICEGCGARVTTTQTLTGSHGQESNFNLVAGLGLPLLSLIAFSKMELEKTVELRRQMESFFQNLKEECESKNQILEPSESEVNCVNEDAQHVAIRRDHHFCADNSPELSIAPSEITLLCDQFSKSDTAPKEESPGGIYQFEDLEVELETELELLQLHLQADESSHHEWQTGQKSADTPTASSCTSSTAMVYDQQADTIEQCGVNPYELERRLHEVLEARQEERIRELESDIKKTKQMLQEKDTESGWSKDTSKIIPKHLAESSFVLR